MSKVIDLGFEQYLFERVYKYLEVSVRQRNNMHNEIEPRLSSANRGYHTMRINYADIEVTIERN